MRVPVRIDRRNGLHLARLAPMVIPDESFRRHKPRRLRRRDLWDVLVGIAFGAGVLAILLAIIGAAFVVAIGLIVVARRFGGGL